MLFILAGIFEIGGGYLIWLWLCEGKGLIFAFSRAIVLFLYGIVPTFQPSYFHLDMRLMEAFLLLYPSSRGGFSTK